LKREPDRRVARTREALQRAFNALFFKGGYESFTVSDVAEQANVGRSTFYEHFDSKEDILWACMSRMFAVFAESVSSDVQPARLQGVLEHLWQNRRLADAIFTGTPRLILSRSLAALIEARLGEMAGRRRCLVNPRLAAIQVAEAQLVLVETWLRGRAAGAPVGVSQALHASSRAGARALLFGLEG
jgi:AcrR family transcriptional regulator